MTLEPNAAKVISDCLVDGAKKRVLAELDRRIRRAIDELDKRASDVRCVIGREMQKDRFDAGAIARSGDELASAVRSVRDLNAAIAAVSIMGDADLAKVLGDRMASFVEVPSD